MSQDSEDFGSLRRLLALKRHEQPPPGYFNHFSSEVIARIEAGDRGQDNPLERIFWDSPWLQRLWAALETKPVMAGAFGAAACALLIGGVIYAEKADVQPVAAGPETTVLSPMQLANASASGPAPFVQPVSADPSDAAALPASMSAAAAAPGIFGLLPKPKAQAASAPLSPLSLSGGN